jgi:Uncharacterised nucleotidyltransferase
MTFDTAALPREVRLILTVCRPEPYPSMASDAAGLLREPLDWNRIVPLVAKHKVLPLFWDRMRAADLIKPALRTGGLSKLWAHHLRQLYIANRERSGLFMEMLEADAAGWRAAGLDLAVLKGGALIGSLYQPANRMLHDIDLAADRSDAGKIKEYFTEAGYRYGVFDDATDTLRPLSRKAERMWLFYNHTLPPFFKETGSSLTPFNKVQVGFNFFDNSDPYSFDLADVAATAVDKVGGSALRVPRPEHMLLNLCTHIYREGVSLVYADVNDNWQLIKFCDLLGYLHAADSQLNRETFRDIVRAARLEQVCAFAFHYTALVYPDELLTQWCQLLPGASHDLTAELQEGGQQFSRDEPFEEQLFSLRPHRTPQSKWNQGLGQEEW